MVHRGNIPQAIGDASVRLLSGAICRLASAPIERETLICRFVHGMRFQEIAGQMGISVEAAKKRAQRALIQLRANYGPH